MTFLANPIVASCLFFFSMVVFYYYRRCSSWRCARACGARRDGRPLRHERLPLRLVLIGADPGPPKWPASYRLLMLFATIGFHAFFGGGADRVDDPALCRPSSSR